MKKILRPLFSVILFIAVAFFAMRFFEQAQPAFSPSEETDPQSYVYVSEGTVILDNELPEEEILKQLEKAVAEKAEHICIRDHERFEWHDLLSLDYSSFWLKEFGTVSYPDSRIEGDEKDSEITFYEMTYCDLSDEEIAAMKAEIDGVANDILAQIPEDADLWHKIKRSTTCSVRRPNTTAHLRCPTVRMPTARSSAARRYAAATRRPSAS